MLGFLINLLFQDCQAASHRLSTLTDSQILPISPTLRPPLTLSLPDEKEPEVLVSQAPKIKGSGPPKVTSRDRGHQSMRGRESMLPFLFSFFFSFSILIILCLLQTLYIFQPSFLCSLFCILSQICFIYPYGTAVSSHFEGVCPVLG